VHNQETCFDCGKLSPPTNTDNTLTTSFGWRMVRRPSEQGELRNEWRCPTCWARFKAQKGLSSGDTIAPPPVRKKP
jgi:hypothetical protein